MMIRDRLLNRLPKERAYKVGVSAKDLESLKLTDDLKADILAALTSPDSIDVKLGFFFAEQVARSKHDQRFEEELCKIAVRLFESDQSSVKSNCVSIFALFGQKLGNYRELMLRALKDGDPQVRRISLISYGTFALKNTIEPLERFENDDYATEVGMGSHLVYELRNLALETIENVINRKFKKFEKTEVYKGKNVVFWWDWEPFHKWKNSIWHKLRLI